MNLLPKRLPTLSTPRLELRAMGLDDIDALFAIYGDPEVMRYASDPPFPEPATVLQMLVSVGHLLEEGLSLEWGVVERASGQLVGTCGLHSFDAERRAAEVGCMLARSAWGRGLMGEALPVVFSYAREALGLAVVMADIDAENERSRRLFQRLGFEAGGGNLFELPLGG